MSDADRERIGCADRENWLAGTDRHPPATRLDVPGYPDVYYSVEADDFYSRRTGRGMGMAFWQTNRHLMTKGERD